MRCGLDWGLLITRSAVRARPGEPQDQALENVARPTPIKVPNSERRFPNIQWRRAGLAALLMASCGCTTVLSNDGSTVVVDWDPQSASKERAQSTAEQSCLEAGKAHAIEMSDVSANPNVPAWLTRRRVTYRCE